MSIKFFIIFKQVICLFFIACTVGVQCAAIVAAPAAIVSANNELAEDASPEYDAHPQYSFQYSVNDDSTGDHKSQTETRDGDVVSGQVSFLLLHRHNCISTRLKFFKFFSHYTLTSMCICERDLKRIWYKSSRHIQKQCVFLSDTRMEIQFKYFFSPSLWCDDIHFHFPMENYFEWVIVLNYFIYLSFYSRRNEWWKAKTLW